LVKISGKKKVKQLQPSGVEEEQPNKHNTNTNRKTISNQNLKKMGLLQRPKPNSRKHKYREYNCIKLTLITYIYI
jgi:hypothetical protein